MKESGAWRRLQDRAAERWQVGVWGPDSVEVLAEDGAVATLVFRAAETHLGFVVVGVEVVGQLALPITTAMEINARLELGGLAIHDGRYVIRHGLGLETVTLAELDRAIAYLLAVAEAIRCRVAAPVLGCFHYCED